MLDEIDADEVIEAESDEVADTDSVEVALLVLDTVELRLTLIDAMPLTERDFVLDAVRDCEDEQLILRLAVIEWELDDEIVVVTDFERLDDTSCEGDREDDSVAFIELL